MNGMNGGSESLPVNGSSAKKQTRRSIAAIPSSEARTPARTPARRSRKADLSAVSEVSQSVTNCLGPDKDLAESLAAVTEEEEAEGSLANPTPVMKELMKKRKSVAPAKKSPVKASSSSTSSKTKTLAKTKTREISPPPRQDFPCPDQAKVRLPVNWSPL